jgi:hypothetical protein
MDVLHRAMFQMRREGRKAPQSDMFCARLLLDRFQPIIKTADSRLRWDLSNKSSVFDHWNFCSSSIFVVLVDYLTHELGLVVIEEKLRNFMRGEIVMWSERIGDSAHLYINDIFSKALEGIQKISSRFFCLRFSLVANRKSYGTICGSEGHPKWMARSAYYSR